VIFADTHFYLALLNRSDESHALAMRAIDEFHEPSVTTGFVLLEVLDATCNVLTRKRAAEFVSRLHVDPEVTIVPVSDDLLRRGMSLYTARTDKAWSLTDCISFTVMNRFAITDALTADHHFEQAGFRALLKA